MIIGRADAQEVEVRDKYFYGWRGLLIDKTKDQCIIDFSNSPCADFYNTPIRIFENKDVYPLGMPSPRLPQ